MGKVCLGKDRAARCNPRSVILIAKGYRTEYIDALEVEPLCLLVKKASRTRRTGCIGSEAFIIALLVEGNEPKILTANKKDTADFPMVVLCGGNHTYLSIIAWGIVEEFRA